MGELSTYVFPIGKAERQEWFEKKGNYSPTLVLNRQNESLGIINLNIIPINEDGEVIIDGSTMDEGFTVYVHNYAGFLRKPVDGVIHKGRNIVRVKAWRIFNHFTGDWVEQEYIVMVVTKNYFGTTLAKIRPDKPIMNIELRVKMDRKDTYGRSLEDYSTQLIKQLPLPPASTNTIEEEIMRIRTYLAMLEGERKCGLISEAAYLRLKEKLELMLFNVEREARGNHQDPNISIRHVPNRNGASKLLAEVL
ncbi:MAG: hypothetical protein ACUVQ0_06420 [Thermoproteota archaeon]